MPTLQQLYGTNPLLEAARAGLPQSGKFTRPRNQPEEQEPEPASPQPAAPPMPEPNPGIIAKTGRAALGGLAMLGNALDLPGSSVRDVLAGRNPFDQYLTPLSDQNRTTGRDLLRQYGLVGKDDNYGNFGAGMAAELLLDPTTYLGIGALTRAGAAAKKANLLKGAKKAVNSAAKKADEAAAKKAAEEGTSLMKTSPKEVGAIGARFRATPRTLINEAENPSEALQAFYHAGGTEEMMDLPVQTLAQLKIPLADWIPGLKNTKLAGTVDITGKAPKYSSDLPELPSAAAVATGTEAAADAAEAAGKAAPQPEAEAQPVAAPPAPVQPATVQPPTPADIMSPLPAAPVAAPVSKAAGKATKGKLYDPDEFRAKIGLSRDAQDLPSFVANDAISLAMDEGGGKASAQDVLDMLHQIGPENGLHQPELDAITQIIRNVDAAKPKRGKKAAAQTPAAPLPAAPAAITPPVPSPASDIVSPPLPATPAALPINAPELAAIAPPIAAAPTSLPEKILAALDTPGQTAKGIARTLKMKPADVSAELTRLNETGHVALDRKGNWSATGKPLDEPPLPSSIAPPVIADAANALPDAADAGKQLPEAGQVSPDLERARRFHDLAKEIADTAGVEPQPKLDAAQLTDMIAKQEAEGRAKHSDYWNSVIDRNTGTFKEGAIRNPEIEAESHAHRRGIADLKAELKRVTDETVPTSPVTDSAPIIKSKNGKVDYMATDKAFADISPRHAAYGARLAAFRDRKLLSEGDTAFVQSMLADSSMEHIPDFKPGSIDGLSEPGIHGAALRVTDDNDPSFLQYQLHLSDPKNLPKGLNQSTVLLHETGHLVFHELQRTDPDLFNAASSFMQKAIEDGSIGKYFDKAEIASLAEHVSQNPAEVFAQMFAHTSTKNVAELPAPVIGLMKKAWSNILDYAKKIIGLGDKSDPRLGTIEKLARYGGGFLDKPQRDELMGLLGNAKAGADLENVNYMRSSMADNNGYSQKIRGALSGGADAAAKTMESAKAWIQKLPKDFATPIADALDKGGNIVLSIPGVKTLSALFDPTVFGATTEGGREIGRERYDQIQNAIVDMRRTIDPLVDQLHSSGLFDVDTVMAAEKLGFDEAMDAVNERSYALRRYLEGIDEKPFKSIGALEGTYDIVRQMMDSIRDLETKSGLNVRHLFDNEIDYVPRAKRSPNKSYTYSPHIGPVFDVTHDAMKQREEFLRNLPGGTAVVNEMSVDPKLSGLVHTSPVIRDKLAKGEIKELREYVAKKYGDRLDREFTENPGFAFDPKKDNRFDPIITMMANLDPGHVKEKLPVFGRNVLQDISERMENGFRASYLAQAAQELVGRTLVSIGKATRESQLVAVDKMLKDIELLGPKTLDNVVAHMPAEVAARRDQMLASTANDLVAKAANAKADKPIYETMANGRRQVLQRENDGQLYLVQWDKTKTAADGSPLPKEQTVTVKTPFDLNDEEAIDALVRGDVNREVLSDYGVPKDVYNDATRWLKPYSMPEEVNLARQAMSRFLNVFRANQTAPFPAFHMRNFISGQMQNVIHKAFDPTEKNPVMKVLRPITEAYAMRGGAAIKGIAEKIKEFRGLTDREATDKLASEIFAHGLVGSKQGLAAELIGDDISKLASQKPGLNKEVNPIKGQFSAAPAGRTWLDFANPLAVNGGMSPSLKAPYVKEYSADMFAGAHYGRDIASFVEDLNRIAPYIAYRKQGYSAAAAADMVNKVQIDYSKLSSFERRTMRMIFPFYTFSSRVLPLTLEELVENPGGLQASLIKTANRGRDPHSTAPDYISQSAAIPLGKLPDGSDRYITGFGLAFEDPAKFATLLGGDSADALRELGSRMNPLIKGPIEWGTGHSLFMDGPEGGRPLGDMDPTLGRIRSNLYDIATGNRTERPAPFISPGFEFAMQNSPLARFGTTLRQATDMRKLQNPLAAALDLGTGVKIADVSPAAQDSILMQRIGKMFKDMGGREQRVPYLPEQALEGKTPEELKTIEEIQDTAKTVAKRRKLRRQMQEEQKAAAESEKKN